MNEQSTKNYWWRFKHEHVRHTRHLKTIYWGLFSVGVTIAALALAPIILVFYYVLHDLHIHIGNRTRNIFYAIAILGALITLCVGW